MVDQVGALQVDQRLISLLELADAPLEPFDRLLLPVTSPEATDQAAGYSADDGGDLGIDHLFAGRFSLAQEYCQQAGDPGQADHDRVGS